MKKYFVIIITLFMFVPLLISCGTDKVIVETSTDASEVIQNSINGEFNFRQDPKSLAEAAINALFVRGNEELYLSYTDYANSSKAKEQFQALTSTIKTLSLTANCTSTISAGVIDELYDISSHISKTYGCEVPYEKFQGYTFRIDAAGNGEFESIEVNLFVGKHNGQWSVVGIEIA